MATKTFKIGLSNTDKQNMADDVYERVIDMSFTEYDPTAIYDIGDFVVYEGVLYQCTSEEVTGEWDSSEWEQATLQDLIDNVQDAVSYINDKANVDGNYPTMTVGVADNLSPYDEESGIKQHAPFNFQASGTNNGDDPTAIVGALAIMKEKRGNTVVVNQLVNPANYVNVTTQGYTNNGITYTKQADGSIIMNGTAEGSYSSTGILFEGTLKGGHKYLFIGAPSGGNDKWGFGFGSSFTNRDTGSGFIYEQSVDAGPGITFYAIEGITFNNVRFTPFIIDLTQWFNGDVPQDLLDHPENFFRYYQGSLAYNEGTLVNANSRYLKAIGRQQWDEEWELGYYDTNTGESVGSISNIRCKNYIRVIPNTSYYCHSGGNGNIWALFYDKDYNLVISNNENVQASSMYQNAFQIENSTFNVPSNAQYIRFYATGTYGTTYNNDITISIYYEGESGYDQYYPYELLTNNDTGTEVLRSAGEVFDSKAPDGTITRRVGYVDLSTLTWGHFEGDSGYYYVATISNMAYAGGFGIKGNAVSEKYEIVAQSQKAVGKAFVSFEDTHQLYILMPTNTSPTGMFYYELAEPTTEQGTPYSENIAIDDFGTMDFSGTSGVPQGNALFYPVDYKAYLDTLHKYTDGDPANLTLNSELNSKFESYLKSLSGYDASATQVLKNISGTLTWVTEGE